jgi:hypothetical protein
MDQVKLVILGFVGMGISAALMASTWTTTAPKYIPKDATYNFYIPKSCAGVDITSWSKGHEHFKSDVGPFLTMKRAIEACGGRVELAGKN